MTTAAQFKVLEQYYPLFKTIAFGDTDEDREDSFCALRLHVARKMPKYKPKKGYGFSAWVKTVAMNWRISQARKVTRDHLSYDDDLSPADVASASAIALVDILDVYERLSDAERVVFSFWSGQSTNSQMSDALDSLGLSRKEQKTLIDDLRTRLQDELKEWRS